ncbi:MAG: hypothetical protein U0163_18905 [Gemmatimonadaceae bacterium]
MLALRDTGTYAVIQASPSLKGIESGLLQSWLREIHQHAAAADGGEGEHAGARSNAINVSAPFRLLAKPFTAEALRHSVLDAMAEYSRGMTQHSIIEETLHGSLEAIAAMLAVVQPAAFGRAMRLRRMATLLADKIGIPDKWESRLPPCCREFGTLSLPGELRERSAGLTSRYAAENAQLRSAVDATLHLLEPIPRMARVCEILRKIELVPARDLHGDRPSQLTGDAERVLTLAIDFDALYADHGSADAALRVMESHLGRYHAPYFDALRELVGVPNAATLVDVPLADVRVGQVFAADVRSPNDLLLVARGQPVTPPLLFKIRNDWHAFAVLTMVRVVNVKAADQDKTFDVKDANAEAHRAA